MGGVGGSLPGTGRGGGSGGAMTQARRSNLDPKLTLRVPASGFLLHLLPTLPVHLSIHLLQLEESRLLPRLREWLPRDSKQRNVTITMATLYNPPTQM